MLRGVFGTFVLRRAEANARVARTHSRNIAPFLRAWEDRNHDHLHRLLGMAKRGARGGGECTRALDAVPPKRAI